MTKEFKEMLEIFSSACVKSESKLNITCDTEIILQKAYEQSVFHLVFAGLKPYYETKEIEIKNYDEINSYVLSTCLERKIKNSLCYNLLKQFSDMDVKYAVLKGDTLSPYYRYPAMRLSGDIDILIDQEDEVKVLDFMSKNGFTYEARNEGSNHTVCYHPAYGVVEVHISLYCNFMDDLWFKNSSESEEYTYIDLPEGKEPTLSITDGYIYTVFHTIKHFLSNGLSVKQIMDIILYTKANFDKINFKKAFGVFEENKFLKMVHCFYYISNHYFNIKIFDDSEDFKDVAEKLLTECEDIGAFGKKSDLKDFFEIYTKMKIDKNGEKDFQTYMTSWRRNSLKGYLSMSEESMNSKYPNLKTGKARVIHLKNVLKKAFKYSRKIKQFVKYKPQSISGEMKNRIDIINKLDMV